LSLQQLSDVFLSIYFSIKLVTLRARTNIVCLLDMYGTLAVLSGPPLVLRSLPRPTWPKMVSEGSNNGLPSLPYQLIIDDIVPLIDLHSLLALRTTSKDFARLVDDELVWRRRIKADYHFPLRSSARRQGWKQLYKGLSQPELYTWGDIGNSRLGVDLQWHNRHGTMINAIGLANWNVITRVRCMPFPLHIAWAKPDIYECRAEVTDGVQHNFERPPNFNWQRNIPYKLIVPRGRTKQHAVQAGVPVELHAGGWSFFALTNVGQVLAWGASTGRNESSGTEGTFATPTLLDLDGSSVKSLTVGREHVVAQTSDGHTILEWSKRWDRPAAHSVDTILIGRSPHMQIRQIEAGWDFTALLLQDSTNGESTIALWKTEWTYVTQQAQWFERATTSSSTSDAVGTTWPVEIDMIPLPELGERIEQIAAGDNFIIALTKSGTLHSFEIPTHRVGNTTDQSEARARAEALQRSMVSNYSRWSELEKFNADGVYEAGWNQDKKLNVWDRERLAHLLKSPKRFTHISAQFKSFAAYAPDAGSNEKSDPHNVGIVILGNKDQLSQPIIVADLQGIGVIKVSHGDYHSGALTSDGRVLSWGKQSNGALGTWDSTETPENAQNILSIDQTRTMAGPQFRAGGLITGAFRALMRRNTDESGDAEQQSADLEVMVRAEKRRYLLRRLVDEIDTPQQVRFGFPCLNELREGRPMTEFDELETKRVFDIAFAGWHSGALAVDKSLTDG
jgi:SCF-associated factor 1